MSPNRASTTKQSLLTRIVSAGLILSSALAASACQQDEGNALCGAAPTEPIVTFAVTTTTGDNGTNADIYFCVTRKSTGAEECDLLDTPLSDDFETGEVTTYRVSLSEPIAPVDLAYFVIKNTGNGFLDEDWTMAALRVEAGTADGESVLLYEEQMDEHLDVGDSYDSSQCTY